MSYSVKGDTFVPGPVRTFGGDVRVPLNGARLTYSIPPQGNRIVALQAAKEPENATRRAAYLLLFNVFDEVKRRALQDMAH